MTDPIAEGWIDIQEAANLSGYSTAYVRLLARGGQIAAQRVNRGWLVNLGDLLAYKRQMEALGTGKHDPTAPWRKDK